ncbi:phage minor head protein [Cupriavidus metallidurans]|uniref:phage head morphogenesis protein n=1 Tax=Cupriavidus metallidurans TaxID=119219 RepID=UPI001CB88B7E|nr:phage minor head protein [Cupriavidus metallidurans]
MFGLEPKDVIAYFQRKGFAITWNWQEVLNEAHAHAFTVAKVMQLDILQDIHDALDTAIRDAQPYVQFVDQLEPILKRKGWWGRKEVLDADTGEITSVQLGSPRRLWTIYQTNMQSAYMAGRYKAMMEATDTHPYWQYVAVMDGRTRPSHRALNGRVYRFDDPFWATFYPPLGWNCRCRVRPVSEATLARMDLRARQSGSEPIRVKKIELPSGDKVAVTAFRTVDSKTGKRIVVQTDPGFSFNPGRAAWEPDAGRWRGPIADLAKQTWQ